ncbi:hypothetical protein ACFL54_05040 [Planctomycetota bacterium]
MTAKIIFILAQCILVSSVCGFYLGCLSEHKEDFNAIIPAQVNHNPANDSNELKQLCLVIQQQQETQLTLQNKIHAVQEQQKQLMKELKSQSIAARSTWIADDLEKDPELLAEAVTQFISLYTTFETLSRDMKNYDSSENLILSSHSMKEFAAIARALNRKAFKEGPVQDYILSRIREEEDPNIYGPILNFLLYENSLPGDMPMSLRKHSASMNAKLLDIAYNAQRKEKTIDILDDISIDEFNDIIFDKIFYQAENHPDPHIRYLSYWQLLYWSYNERIEEEQYLQKLENNFYKEKPEVQAQIGIYLMSKHPEKYWVPVMKLLKDSQDDAALRVFASHQHNWKHFSQDQWNDFHSSLSATVFKHISSETKRNVLHYLWKISVELSLPIFERASQSEPDSILRGQITDILQAHKDNTLPDNIWDILYNHESE